jgi:diguanylate cyclase (GGDEF)-like protein
MSNHIENIQSDYLSTWTTFFAQKLCDTVCDMTGIVLSLKSGSYKEESFTFDQGMTVYISFYGQVQGGFVIGVQESEALRLIGIEDDSGDYKQYREDISGFFKEVMNIAVAQTLPELESAFANLTQFPAIVAFGDIVFPDVRSGLVNIEGDSTHIKCGFSLNLVSAKIVRKLEKVEKSLESTEKLARTDALTKLYNRTFFESVFNVYIEDARNTGQKLSLLLVDIDYFKTVNDTYGHLVGDQVIKLVAQSIKDVLRNTDIAVRYGGDEMLVVLPDTDKLKTRLIAERIRNVVKVANIVHAEDGSNVEVKVTISIGCTELAPNDNPVSFFERADANLYKAKESGRDQVYTEIDA